MCKYVCVSMYVCMYGFHCVCVWMCVCLSTQVHMLHLNICILTIIIGTIHYCSCLEFIAT